MQREENHKIVSIEKFVDQFNKTIPTQRGLTKKEATVIVGIFTFSKVSPKNVSTSCPKKSLTTRNRIYLTSK